MFIQGKKVLLRAVELSDAELLRDMMNDSDIERMVGGYSFPVSQHQQLRWIENLANEKNVLRAIIDVDGTAVGTVMLTDIDMKNGTAEGHIKLARSAERGRGYGSDAMSALVGYAFNELRLNCVYCRIKEDNVASRRMFEKCGFRREGCLRSRIYRDGRHYDVYEYSILRDEYTGG